MRFAKDQLLPGETIVIRAHQHYVVLLRAIVLNIATAAVLAGLCYALGRYWILLFDLPALLYLGWEIHVRNRREYIVTNRRVVKQEGVFSISSFDAQLDKINNVFHEQTLLGRILNYGNVGLETASEQGTTRFQYIPNPVQFKNRIVAERERHLAGAAPRSREDIPQLLERLASLRDRKVISAEEFEEKKKSLLDQL